jgi:hypothetical protein
MHTAHIFYISTPFSIPTFFNNTHDYL